MIPTPAAARPSISIFHSNINLKCRSHCFSGIDRDVNILLDGTTADTNGTNEISIMVVDRLTARKYHQTIVRGLKTPKIVARARLRAVVKTMRWELAVEQDNSLGLLLRHVDAAVVRVVHMDEGNKVGRGIKNGDVLEYTNETSVSPDQQTSLYQRVHQCS